MSKYGEVCDGLEKMVAKLYVLRDSCTGMFHTEKSNPNLIWFQGAAAILQEAVIKLTKALHTMEGGEACASTDSGDARDEPVRKGRRQKEARLTEDNEISTSIEISADEFKEFQQLRKLHLD